MYKCSTSSPQPRHYDLLIEISNKYTLLSVHSRSNRGASSSPIIPYQTNTIKNTMRFTSILATLLLSTTLASAQCTNRLSCSPGDDSDCFLGFFNQGGRGGRCRQNIGSPGGYSCDCY